MTPDEHELAAAIRRFATIWTIYGNVAGGGDYVEDDVLWRRWADNAFTAWNFVFVAPDAETPEAIAHGLAAGADYLRRQSKPGTVVAARERLARLSAGRLGELGLRERAAMVAMDGAVSRMTLPPSSDLRIERVTAMPMLETYSDINAAAYGLPRKAARAGIAVAPGTMMLNAFSFIGYEGEDAVAVASVLPHEDRLYLGLVATAPQAQRRGFASQIIGHALRTARAATGIDLADLHATVAGAPVYEKLGYRTTVTFLLLERVD